MLETIMPHVVVETASYQNAVKNIWDDDEQSDFKNYIATHPYAGDIISGTNGIRKIRWHSSGRGKRGGARVIYYIYDDNNPLYLLFAYPKNVQADLSNTDKKAFATLVTQLKNIFREKKG